MSTLVETPTGPARRPAGRFGAALATAVPAPAFGPPVPAADPGSVPPLECSPGKVCREPETFLPARRRSARRSRRPGARRARLGPAW